MRKLIVAVFITVAVVLLWPEPTVRAGGPCSVPKSWGRPVAMNYWASSYSSVPMMLLEAEDGTLRMVSLSNCKLGETVTRSAD